MARAFGTKVPCERCGGELKAVWDGDPPTHFVRCSKCSHKGLWKHLAQRLHPSRFDREKKPAPMVSSSIKRPTRRW